MDAIRAFIAIELPEEIRQKLAVVEQQIQARAGDTARRAVRWVPTGNMHLTLKFLGEVSTGNVKNLAQMMQNEAARCAGFELRLHGIGAFPNIRRPRVVWIGVEAPQALFALQRAIENGARQFGYAEEERPFSPHLTLGRVTQNARPEEIAQLARALEGFQAGEIGRMAVKTIHLFQSDLKPGGAVYTSLYHSDLR